MPNDEHSHFTGSVTIDGELQKDTNTIELHAKDLHIVRAVVGDQEVTTSYEEKTDTLTLTAPESISKGKITLDIEYSSDITSKLHGIYPSTFKNSKGEDETMLATQLESHHAREVLPCIDEPAAKATFNLTLRVNKGHVGLSNTPIASEKVQDDGSKLIRYEKTPKMSIYLLAFVSGDLVASRAKTKRGVDVAVWSTHDKADQTSFALEVAKDCLDFYEAYFKIDYPLAKCDLIALPDFVTGAMENWGCITFRETAMLVDESTSQSGKQWVAEVVAHELAHQWFGNLVTMQWWTDLWLNEGFASWIGVLAVDQLFPEWNMWTDFILSDTFRGQSLDSLESSHPVEVNITDPDEIRSIFDAISYSKGAAVIHMLHALSLIHI